MGKFTDMLWGTAESAVDTGMGMLLGGWNDRRQFNQQAKLQQLQMSGQRSMMDYSMQKQYEFWLKTNYGAQVAEMRKAGINPALLYGMSGGGGVSTGSPTANVTGAEAPKGGGEIPAMMGMAIQRGMAQAQMNLMQAQADNLKADTLNKQTLPGPKQAQEIKESQKRVEDIQSQIDLRAQELQNKEVQQEILGIEKRQKQLDLDLQNATYDNKISMIQAANDQELQKLDILKRENKLQGEQYNERVRALKLDNALKVVQAEAIKQGIALTKKELEIAEQQLHQVIYDYSMSDRREDRAERELRVKENLQSFETDPVNSTMKTIFGTASGILGGIILGGASSGRTIIQGFKQR